MHAIKISDLAAIKNGLIKVTQSLKKMKENFKLMHSKLELNLAHMNFIVLHAVLFYEDREIQGNETTESELFPDHVEPAAFHGKLRIFVSG